MKDGTEIVEFTNRTVFVAVLQSGAMARVTLGGNSPAVSQSVGEFIAIENDCARAMTRSLVLPGRNMKAPERR